MRTHCKRGHELSGANLKVSVQRGGYTQRDCVTCLRLHWRSRKAGERVSDLYVPLDEILASPSIRVLRYLRRCDWVESIDVCDALGVDARKEKARIHSVLKFLVNQGHVDVSTSHCAKYYKINTRGLGKLSAVLLRYETTLNTGALLEAA